MATTTTHTVCPAGAWTEVAAGAATVMVQAHGPAKLAIASTPPALGSPAYIALRSGHGLSRPITLASGDKVYCQPVHDAASIRTVRVA